METRRVAIVGVAVVGLVMPGWFEQICWADLPLMVTTSRLLRFCLGKHRVKLGYDLSAVAIFH